MFARKKKVSWRAAKDQGTGYLVLDGQKRTTSGIVRKTETLDVSRTNRDDLMVNLDFDENERLIGIEVVSFD